MIPRQAFETNKADSQGSCMLLLGNGQRLLLLACLLLLCWVISNVANGLLISRFGLTTRVYRFAAIIQSLVQIILPALIYTVIVSRRPARFIEVDRSPKLTGIFLAVCALIVSMPALNRIIAINASVHLPDALAGAEQWLRRMEDSASGTITLIQGSGSVGDLIMNILIIGIMAGFGEELLFRGVIQRTLSTGGMNTHLAIWLTAALFSAVHLQFFGFVPRLLLGAYFGYLLLWSESLWLPICAHAANNILYVIAAWTVARHGIGAPAEQAGTDSNLLIITVSILLTTLTLIAIKRTAQKNLDRL